LYSAEWGKVDGVGVMKDKELKLEEIEASHTEWCGGKSCPGPRGEGNGEGVDATLQSGTLQ